MEITLSKDQKASLGEDIYKVVINSVDKARKDASLDSKDFFRKKEACKYLGVSNNTFDHFIEDGLTYHIVRGITLYSKEEIKQYILEH
ncbi:helix-turn-helix domain-containing protein [Companilactobacillus nantensis]|uniref:Helix-turn-helix domain-containing protein n=1 Tax=Companilactobacillus nantensis DSM 16982 TaxID=1423774 RepID=A0A0R1WMD3_9LACO|nr:helix-turn-helix domain-containing protein [Companilactobacillus nantensis]KRM15388.1 hypothetical protein FD31_GL001241 [Companilactobacillus nantensis DSM 16982]GEO65050.1 hypothetical protein LNA01_22330 [Companilactobacillus nantensis]